MQNDFPNKEQREKQLEFLVEDYEHCAEQVDTQLEKLEFTIRRKFDDFSEQNWHGSRLQREVMWLRMQINLLKDFQDKFLRLHTG